MEQHPGATPVRRYPRMAAEYSLSYRRSLPAGGFGDPVFSRTRSIGLGGLMFESETPLERGEVLRLEVALNDHTVAAAGNVVYVERRDGGPWQTGVQFTALSEDDRDVLLSVYLQREYRLPAD
jgi:hypothetical protein